MKTVNVIIGLVILTIIIFGVYKLKDKYMVNKNAPASVPIYKVIKKDLVIKISETGKTSAKHSLTITSPIEGKVIKAVPEGNIVKKGDSLIQFDSSELAKQSRDKLLSYQQALADIKQCEEQIAILKETSRLNTKTKISQFQYDETELHIAKNNLSQQKRLFKEQIITKKEVEAAEAAVRSKQSAVNKDKIDIEISRKTNDSDITKKEAELSLLQVKAQQAKLSFEIAQRELSKATITSPGNGMVVYLPFWKGGEEQGKMTEGDQIRTGLPVMEISDTGTINITTGIRESDINKVKIGMKAEITSDSSGSVIFTAILKKITMVATEPRWASSSAPGQSTFPAEFMLEKNIKNLIRPGMNVNVNIILKEVKQVLAIPVVTVFNESSQTYVWLKTPKNYEKKKVITGVENEDFVEIKEGLNEGDEIALRDPNKEIEEPENTEKQDLPVDNNISKNKTK